MPARMPNSPRKNTLVTTITYPRELVAKLDKLLSLLKERRAVPQTMSRNGLVIHILMGAIDKAIARMQGE